MRLADFILSNLEPIVMDWEVFARSIAPGATMDALALRDHANEILVATVAEMRADEHYGNEPGLAGADRRDRDRAALTVASELHAVGRLGSGFDLLEVVSEYRALRASVLELWRESEPGPHELNVGDVTRFNASIDQSLTEAVTCFTQRVDQSRDLFLAILGHDLRNPLNSIGMITSLLRHLKSPDAESMQMTGQIAANVSVMARMISDLLDYTRTRLGAGMPVTPKAVDLQTVCAEVFDEYHTAHPECDMKFSASGDLTGNWDHDRLRQAISNLLGNAIQHGDVGAPIRLIATGSEPEVTLKVYNGGTPIPPGEIARIFEPLVRGSTNGRPVSHRPGSIGLGLYIAREVARAHGGSITVRSTVADGTTFTIHLPRNPPVTAEQVVEETDIRKMAPITDPA